MKDYKASARWHILWSVTRRSRETVLTLWLAFSHLGNKGVGYARHPFAQREAIEWSTLPTKMIRLLAPLAPRLSKGLCQHVLALIGDLLRVAVGEWHSDSPKHLRRMTNLCGVLHGQMAKVELKSCLRSYSLDDCSVNLHQ